MKPSVSVANVTLAPGASIAMSSSHAASPGDQMLGTITFVEPNTVPGGAFLDMSGVPIDGTSIELVISEANFIHLDAGTVTGSFDFTVSVTDITGVVSDVATGHLTVAGEAPTTVSGGSTTVTGSGGSSGVPTTSTFGNGVLDGTAYNWFLPHGLTFNWDVIGGLGSDTLVGFASGSTILYGASGNDLYVGRAGQQDIFVFDTTTGTDTVRGFDLAQDQLEILKMPGLSSFTDLAAALGHNAAGDAVIQLPAIGHGGTITLTGVSPGALTAGNVVFFDQPAGGALMQPGIGGTGSSGASFPAITLRQMLPSTGADHLTFGTTGSDVLTGGSSGSDIFYGGAGNDVMWATTGSASNLFLFDGATDQDIVYNFQPGRDHLEFIGMGGLASWSSFKAGLNADPAGDAVIYFNSGQHQSSVTLIGVTPQSLTQDMVSYFGVNEGAPADTVGGVAYPASYHQGGNPLSNAVGLASSIYHIGSSGSDVMFGGLGNNIFYGGSGNDDLWAWQGTRNVFVFDGEAGQDFVHSFVPGHDTIGFFSDAGFSSPTDVMRALSSDGFGDSVISLPTGGKVTIVDVAPQNLSLGNFAVYAGSLGSAVDPREAALIDTSYYLAHNPDVAETGLDLMQHYVNFGWREGRAPDALFDPAYYLSHNADVAAAGIDPLLHYATVGWREGRDPSASFSTSHYLVSNPDVQLAGIDPLQHYLQYGLAEHRSL